MSDRALAASLLNGEQKDSLTNGTDATYLWRCSKSPSRGSLAGDSTAGMEPIKFGAFGFGIGRGNGTPRRSPLMPLDVGPTI